MGALAPWIGLTGSKIVISTRIRLTQPYRAQPPPKPQIQINLLGKIKRSKTTSKKHAVVPNPKRQTQAVVPTSKEQAPFSGKSDGTTESKRKAKKIDEGAIWRSPSIVHRCRQTLPTRSRSSRVRGGWRRRIGHPQKAEQEQICWKLQRKFVQRAICSRSAIC